jgi:hypothetical protein
MTPQEVPGIARIIDRRVRRETNGATLWRGRRLDSLTQDELIAACADAVRLMEDANQRFDDFLRVFFIPAPNATTHNRSRNLGVCRTNTKTWTESLTDYVGYLVREITRRLT